MGCVPKGLCLEMAPQGLSGLFLSYLIFQAESPTWKSLGPEEGCVCWERGLQGTEGLIFGASGVGVQVLSRRGAQRLGSLG